MLRFTEEEFALHRARLAYAAEFSATVSAISTPKDSDLERAAIKIIAAARFPTPQRNFRFVDGRKFELDFSWPDQKIGLECEGYSHSTLKRFKTDVEKHAIAILLGWRILRVNRDRLTDGSARAWLTMLFGFMEVPWKTCQNVKPALPSAPGRGKI